MPLDPSISLQAKTPSITDALTPISSLLGIQSQGLQQQALRQSIDTGAIEQRRAGVQLSQEQGALDARRNVAKIVSDPSFRGDDGTFDLDKAVPAILSADPNNYVASDTISKLAGANNDIIIARTNKVTWGKETKGYIGQTAGQLMRDPNLTTEKALSGLDDIVKTDPNTKPFVEIAKKHIANISDPNQIRLALQGVYQEAMTPSAQQQAFAPTQTTINTGSEIKPIVMTPSGGITQPTMQMGVGPSIPTTLAPGQQDHIETDPTGNPMIVRRDARGNIIGTKLVPSGVGGGGGSAGGGPITHLAPGDVQAIPALTQERVSVNNAANQVPTQRYNNKQIINIAQEARTGTGADVLGKLLGSVGLQSTNNYGTDVNRLTHFLALQAASSAQAMGLGTDAARETAALASGSIHFTRDALISAVKTNDALSSGLAAYNRSMEQYIKANGGNVLAMRDFKNQWSQYFDPYIFRVDTAIKENDKAELAKIKSELGPNGMAQIAEKSAKLHALMGK